jgi:agmatine/peptidylarginine deiminase
VLTDQRRFGVIQVRKAAWPLCVPIVALLFVLPSPRLRAQTAGTEAPHNASDVVMLAIQALNARAELQQRIRGGIVGDSATDLDVEKRLLAIQMNIVRETAKFGPVLLLAPDETTKSAVYERCQEFQICELLHTDHVRIKVAVHDGVWIRDFGPQIEAAGNLPSVVHWRYFDIRTEEAKREKLQELETARLRLLEARQQQDQPDVLTHELTPDARKAEASTIDDKMYVLREFSQLLNETSPQRANDENSAYDIADAVLAAPDFRYRSSPLALDGGNLFKLDDGRCLTTRVLLSRNKEQNINVDEELRTTGGCKDVTYLEPLPGPVTEHIDMFALPVGGKRILLASYELSKPFAAEYWSDLSGAERDLATDAALAMQANADALRRLGYDVVMAPSPFPRVPENGHIYYPSVLNALVRESADGSRELLVPSYKDYETDIQAAALQQIRAAFGANTEIVTIEATDSAKSQGAIHCLTLSAPLRLSIFGDAAGSARRTAVLAQKEQLDRRAAAEIASQIPATGLQGSWAIVEDGDRTQGFSLDAYPQRIFFSENEFQKGVLDRLESKGKYAVDHRESTVWSLHLQFADHGATPAIVQWLGKDEVKLTLADAQSSMFLRRIASGGPSPFKAEQRSSTHSSGSPK